MKRKDGTSERMKMKYKELIASIREMEDAPVSEMIASWLEKHDYDEADTLIGNLRLFALDIANIAFSDGYKQGTDIKADNVCGNPENWFILDKNGEKVHIGDTFKANCREHELVGFHMIFGKISALFEQGKTGLNSYQSGYIEKVVPDTREYLIGELLDCCIDREFAEDIINRAMRLKGE